MVKYTREQFWKLYEKLPQELKEAIFSEETAESIWNICERYNIDKMSEIAKYVGRVLLGVLPPEDFQKTLERELKLKKEVAKKVNQEIFRFIFFPVKTSLEELYKIEIFPPARPKITPPKKVKPPPKRDIYREPIE